MPEPTIPDYTVFNNSHALMHCGPLGPEDEDIGNDLYVSTSGRCQTHWNKNGNKTEYVDGRWDEVSGFNISQENAIARSIVARNGDLHLNADFGDIYLKARNIYIETKGDAPNGCFLVSANGQMILAAADEAKIASGTNMCIIGKSKITMVGTQLLSSGSFKDAGALSSTDFISSIMAGNFQSLIDGMLQSCK